MQIKTQVQEKRAENFGNSGKYGAYNVRVFGSVARGEADSASDVDFLVEMEAERSLFDLGGLLMDLEALLDCPVDVVTEKGMRQRIRDRVLSEASPMRDEREKLQDILEAIERIDRYAVQGRQAFEQNELIQTCSLKTCKLLVRLPARFLQLPETSTQKYPGQK